MRERVSVWASKCVTEWVSTPVKDEVGPVHNRVRRTAPFSLEVQRHSTILSCFSMEKMRELPHLSVTRRFTH